MTATLQLDQVTKSYPPPAGVTAVAGISLRIDAGEAVAITGPSGSGKSTLLNLLGTIERPTSGSVWFADSDTATMSDRRLSGLRAWRIGFVFQQFHLLEHLSVLDNVATGLLYRGWSAARRRDYAAVALERVALTPRCNHHPSQLSGGERQRTAIARAVAGHPDVILADEPTGNLDSGTGAGIVSLLAGLANSDTVVIVITHDPAVASAMDRQVQLRDGRIVHDSGRR